MLDFHLNRLQGTFQLDATLKVPARGVTALFGRSGSGKTSILRLIAGLERLDHGHLRLAGECLAGGEDNVFVPAHRRQLGVVFQEPRLFPHYTVRGNLCYGMPRALTPGKRQENRNRLHEMVALLGIEDLLARMPGQLSGGEARRVAIGRALLSRPRMLLLDEPLTGLDGARKQELLQYISRLAREIEIPILFVSHDTRELFAVADRLALVDNGRITASGEIGDMLSRLDLAPQTGRYEAGSLLSAEVLSHDDDWQLTRLGLGAGLSLQLARLAMPVGRRVRLRLRARDISIALKTPEHTSLRNVLPAVIHEIETERGHASAELVLGIAGQRVRARVDRLVCQELGLKVGLGIKALISSVALSGPDVISLDASADAPEPSSGSAAQAVSNTASDSSTDSSLAAKPSAPDTKNR
ncbi:molybdenum ABC transporter ATP-binding protein [Cobetia crustatorum]|uniref:molybdenum ABC transporter ATP-binding protein n=1 Tax=Cobetia crustatorum TaxID=553385 RepID=UPI000468FCDF|nr:molybdenum ABC transporter ATP-binding protein [Cobetia crustatorum]